MNTPTKLIILLIFACVSVHMLYATEAEQTIPKKITLKDLQPEQAPVVKRASRPMRKPAAVQVFDPHANARPFMYGACRGPNGRIYRVGEQDYADCHNDDGRFSDSTEFSAKSVGFGLIILD